MGVAIRMGLLCFVLIISVIVEVRGIFGISKQFAVVGAKKCMPVLGCFEITPDFFHLINRPVNLLPQHRRIINTKFLLHTNRNVREVHFLDAEKKKTINDSHFDPNIPTKFIIHGYIDTQGFGPWQDKLKDEFLLKGPHNVIIVDWSGGNSLPYTQATANTRVVGAEVAHLIKTLQQHVGLNPENVHILGHSLGAHAAGYAGERINGLGRITGLDPAEPYFQDLPPSVRLDETDAQFVDVIHTDSKSILLFGLGMSQAVGHIDFYPNNGMDQPGCTLEKVKSFITEGIIEGMRRFVGCNHQRAVDFYHSSIVLTRCAPVAYECSSWEQFLEAKCTDCGSDGSKCAILGDKAIESKNLNQKNKKLYVKTSNTKPYCLFHYKVVIKLLKKGDSKDAKGNWKLSLIDIRENSVGKITSSTIDMFHGSSYMHLLTSTIDVEKVRKVTFQWKSSASILNPFNWFRTPKIHIDRIEMIPMNILDKKKQMQNTKVFCLPNSSKVIDSGKSIRLVQKSKC